MNKTVFIISLVILSGCASKQQPTAPKQETYVINKSYLSAEQQAAAQAEPVNVQDEQQEQSAGYEVLQPLSSGKERQRTTAQVLKQFSNSEKVTLAADNMPVDEFLHYAFGEVLGKNYVLAPELKSSGILVTLNVQQAISKREMFKLISDLLTRQQITLDFNEEVFFFQTSALGKAKAVIGIGRTPESVPGVTGQILQVIPLRYGIKVSIERTVRDLIDAVVTPDFEQSALFVLGDRNNVLRAIELIELLDVPANRGKNIGLITLTYIGMDDFSRQVSLLMANEGIQVGINDGTSRNVSMVPLVNIGSVAIFTTSDELLNRVRYWASVLDKPAKGDKAQYFIYHPRFARATDLGDSVGQLLTLSGASAAIKSNEQSTGANADTLKAETVKANRAVSSEAISFVVDERSNSLIFKTTGTEYQNFLPLLKKLDVLPKQVLIEVMLAEVTMTDDFKYGVEFALKNSSKLDITTLGAFGAGKTGGINLNFLDGGTEAVASFFKDNKYINVISNPSLLVRDGVSATITAGEDIPTSGGTITDDGVTTTNVVYRRTGVNVSVTPTINAQGVVIMTISQQLSNQVDTSTSENSNPSIFERSLETEAVVESGRTVLLGGLISESSSTGQTKVPGFGDLPLLGNLFKGQNDQLTKKELVMLITPKVIENNDQWQKLMLDFQSGLETIRIIE